MNQTKTINGTPYANPLRNSFLPFSVNLSGKEVWTVKPPSNMELGNPIMLSVSGTTLFILCQRGGYAVDISSGTVLWGKEFVTCAEPLITDDYIRIVDDNHFLEHIDLTGKSIKRFGVPILVRTFKMYDLFLSSDRIFLFLNRYPNRFDVPQPEGLIITSYIRSKDDIELYKEYEDLATGYALSPETDDLYISTDKAIYKTSPSARKETDIKTIDITGIRSLSMDYSGNLLLMKTADKTDALCCTDGEGITKWEIPMPELGKFIHPPACSGENVVYCSPNQTLFCIKDGQILWKEGLQKLDPHGLMLTVLNDNSVLAAGGSNIKHITQKGDTVLVILTPFVLTCRPVPDQQGNLFAAGLEGVKCYN